ncbi:MAG: hypothetical protein KDJ80_02605 [Nitratireductor sp.]|nr:hypothetical protein [Nitratireductor sp.]
MADIGKKSGIVAAAMVPHAPQFLSRPSTEDLDQVERVHQCLHSIGDFFRSKNPDVIVVITNDHGDEFVTHCVPPFCVHVADQAEGMHKHRGKWSLHGKLGYALVPEMMDLGIDLAFTLKARLQTAFTIPFDFMGFERETPMLAIFVNSYVPPQPSAERCFAFGKALDRALANLGVRAALVASGGLSHYPGTKLYPNPDVTTDKGIFERMCEGDLQHLAGLSTRHMDKTGNVELRSVQILAGAIGDRIPIISQFEPSWHHTYASMAWDIEAPNPLVDDYEYNYPPLPGDRVDFAHAIFTLRSNPKQAAEFIRDPQGWLNDFDLTEEERQALLNFDAESIRDKFRIHALLTAGADFQMKIQREKMSNEG